MGSGIAQVSAVAGHDVILRDISLEAVDKGRVSDRGVVGEVRREGRDRRRGRRGGTGPDHRARPTSTAQRRRTSIVEAIIEKVDLKAEVCSRRWTDRAPEGAILATNTSAIPITRIAAVTAAPGVRRRHALLLAGADDEALRAGPRAYKTSDETLAAARTCAEGIGKTVHRGQPRRRRLRDHPLITALVNEAIRLVESGVATAEDVDTACRLGFGHAMGPLATADLTGVDVMRRRLE